MSAQGATAVARRGVAVGSLFRHGVAAATVNRTKLSPYRRTPLAVPIIAVLLAAIATSLSASHGWMALYNDARSHLDIARRLTDSATPGLGQLGTVWLPLPHLLMSPLTAITAAWHSAAAGAIVSGIAFVYSAVRIFGVADEWFQSRLAAWCAFAVYALNLNLLYMQSTALVEPLMLACLVGTVYHLVRWTRTHALVELMWAGAAIALGTLTRYDAWAVFLAALVAVFIWSRVLDRRPNVTQANFLILLLVGGFGILLWLAYNLVIFHDVLYFLHGQVTEIDLEFKRLTCISAATTCTDHNIVQSVITYGWAIVDTVGAPVLALGMAGAVVMLIRRRMRAVASNLALLMVLAAPIALNIFTLFMGQTTMLAPQVAPYRDFNLRFGMEALPFAAVGMAALAAQLRTRLVLLPVAAGAAAITILATLSMSILAEAQTGASGYRRVQGDQAGAYLSTHYNGGSILIDETQTQQLIFAAGLDLRAYTTVRSHGAWEHALADPADSVRWVVVSTGDAANIDAVTKDLQAHPDRFQGFTLVYSVPSFYDIYERVHS